MATVEAGAKAPRVIARQVNTKLLILAISRVWSWLFLIGVIIYFSIEGTGFFTLRNSQNILITIVPILLMGLGQTFVIIAGGIDLSVGWVMGLSSVVSARIMRGLVLDTRPDAFTSLFEQLEKIGLSFDASIIIIGFVVGFFAACLAGFVNGLIIAKLRVQAFIVTLGVSFVARGLAWIWSEGNVVSGLPNGLRKLGNNALMYYVHGEGGGIHFLEKPDVTGAQLRGLDRIIHWPVLIAFVLLFFGIYLLTKTQFGRHTYAIGGNREAAVRAGVPVDRHTIMLYTLSGATAGIAGLLYNARFMGGAADAGDALLMMSIAAVVIGGVSLMGGEGRLTGTLVGALILAVLETGLIMIDTDPFWKYVIVGIIIVLAVLIDQARDLVVGRAEAEVV